MNETLLDICIEGGGKDARFLLAHGADANNRRGDGWCVLERAAQNDNPAVVEALLDAGAGDLAEGLCASAAEGHTALAALLLDRGADVHAMNDAALFSAALNGRLETATLLLQRGATAENYILDRAVQRGHHAVADLLRAHGAVV